MVYRVGTTGLEEYLSNFNNEEIEYPIEELLVILLGISSSVANQIDTIYDWNKKSYYKAYKENSSKYKIVSRYLIQEEAQIRKVIGIVEYDKQQNSCYNTTKLIKIAYKGAYDLVNKYSKIDAYLFQQMLAKQSKKSPVSELELAGMAVVILWYYEVQGRKGEEILNKLLVTLVNRWIQEDGLLINGHNEVDFQMMRQKLSIPKKVQKVSYAHFLEYTLCHLYEKGMQDISTATFNHEDTIKMIDMKNLETIDKLLIGCKKAISQLGLSQTALLSEMGMEDDDIDTILSIINQENQDYNLTVEEQKDRLIVYVYISALIKAYNDAKRVCLDEGNEQAYIELCNKEIELDEYAQNLNSIKKENEMLYLQLEDKYRTLESKYRELQKENEKLVKENQKLEKKIAKLDNYSKEIDGLRNYVFNQSKVVEDIPEIFNVNEAFQKLTSLKGVVLGGSATWSNKMKEIFDTYYFYGIEDINKDLQVLSNAEVVFINTAHISHSLYYKVVKYLNKGCAKVVYLSGASNEEFIIKEMYNGYNS